MIKSTAPAGTVESPSSPPLYYLWEFPQKPVSVRLSLDVVDRLERDVLESFRAITARGSEVGGLLLGRSEAGPTLKTVVESYELFHCDYTRGPLYLLSDEEKARLEDTIRRKKGGPGQAGAIVGFFRSNTRKDLALDEEDLELFQKYFARPEQIFLLVKPYAAKASAAGIFIWEGEKVRGEGSYIEFPFRRADLGKGDFAKSIVTEKIKSKDPAPAVEPPVPLPNVHKSGARAPVLPFALKRDEEPPVAAPPLKREDRKPRLTLTPKPEPEEAAAAPAATEPMEIPAEERTPPQTAPEAVPVARRPVEKPLASVLAAALEEKKAEPAAVPARESAVPKVSVDKPAAEEKPAPAAASIPAPKLSSLPTRSALGGRKLWALFGGLTMLGLAGGTLYYLKSHTAGSGVIAARESGTLDLKAEHANGQLLVTWNRSASSIRNAQHAVLSITDGARKEDVPLDLTQLRGGSIVYSPDPKGSGAVTFRLEITDGTSRTRSESVRVTTQATDQTSAPQPNPAEISKPTAQQAQKTPPTQEAARVAPEVQPPATIQPTPEPAQPVHTPAAPPPKPFSLAARVRSPEPTDLPDAPNVGGGSSNLRPVVPAATTQLAPPRTTAPPVQTAQAPTPAVPAAEPVKVGGKVQEPRLLRKVEPIYPPMARQNRVSGVVHMRAAIGKDGKIHKVDVVSGPPLLRQAAAEAVQKWVYSPSLLNGLPVDSTTDVELSFTLSVR